MALVGNVQAATRTTAAMLLLALVIAAAAVSPSDAADQPAGCGSTAKKIATSRDDDDGQLPLTSLTQCVAQCGTHMSTCSLDCYKPLVRGDPVALPLCLLNCSNDAATCVTGCATFIG